MKSRLLGLLTTLMIVFTISCEQSKDPVTDEKASSLEQRIAESKDFQNLIKYLSDTSSFAIKTDQVSIEKFTMDSQSILNENDLNVFINKYYKNPANALNMFKKLGDVSVNIQHSFPEVSKMSLAERKTVFDKSISLINKIDPINLRTTGTNCQACADFFTEQMNQATGLFAAASAYCVLTAEVPPVLAACMAIAGYQYYAATQSANIAFNTCIAQCDHGPKKN